MSAPAGPLHSLTCGGRAAIRARSPRAHACSRGSEALCAPVSAWTPVSGPSLHPMPVRPPEGILWPETASLAASSRRPASRALSRALARVNPGSRASALAHLRAGTLSRAGARSACQRASREALCASLRPWDRWRVLRHAVSLARRSQRRTEPLSAIGGHLRSPMLALALSCVALAVACVALAVALTHAGASAPTLARSLAPASTLTRSLAPAHVHAHTRAHMHAPAPAHVLAHTNTRTRARGYSLISRACTRARARARTRVYPH